MDVQDVLFYYWTAGNQFVLNLISLSTLFARKIYILEKIHNNSASTVQQSDVTIQLVYF